MSPSRHHEPPNYVIDTSTLCRGIRAFFVTRWRKSLTVPAAILLDQWQAKSLFIWIYTDEILDEYKQVLNRLDLTHLPIGRTISAIQAGGKRVIPVAVPRRSSDPADHIFYEAAEACGRGTAIVTTNPAHFPPSPTTRVLSPEDALKELGLIE